MLLLGSNYRVGASATVVSTTGEGGHGGRRRSVCLKLVPVATDRKDLPRKSDRFVPVDDLLSRNKYFERFSAPA